MSPTDRIDPAASQAAAEAAIQQVTANADEDWKEEARSATRKAAFELRFFTTDDIWERMDPAAWTHERRAMGGILRWAQSEGLVENTQRFQKSRRLAPHRRPLALWQSLVYRTEATTA
jgi:hypothetical protein